jgi:hypothetical protein
MQIDKQEVVDLLLESDKGAAEERKRPDPDEPWAKTSSGDADNVASD